MKLKVRKNKYSIGIYLPLSLIKSRILFKLVISKANSDEIVISRDILKQLYKDIKAYTKKHGHFKMLEVNKNDYEIDLII